MGVNDFHIGLLRQKGVLEKNAPVAIDATTSNDKRDNWTEVVTCKGYLKEGRGSRKNDVGEIVFDSRTTYRVRHQDAIWNELNNSANKSFKWTIDGRVFTVDGWQKKDEKQVYIDFTINEMK